MGNGRAAAAAVDVEARRRGTVTVDVTDELDIATIPSLRGAVEEALRGRPQTLVVDLSRCGFLGVDALGVLVGLTAAARRQGTTLTLVGLSDVARGMVSVLDLDGALLYAPPQRPGSR